MQAVLYSMFVLLCSRVARFVRKRFVLGLNLTVGDELYRLNQKHLRITWEVSEDSTRSNSRFHRGRGLDCLV